ncbi:elongation factor 4 [Candidatus Uhrbacteria bacterium CG_4_9_14_0_2_um_filter_41_50]|uniref:Elongation factor 4 n=1 Tax=Candidatus Uhrbacteria bacterium CG_4_9_14_0_2_um_filter_41_50 TaxID=1975031 RepID=A0A2M8ENA6_9BACT|nr:MAG: elongation factor 4 [Candidatus Uhrbacteria bacterium CG_4_10_14_3_um_filter_41_21]PIZ54200.1 MAG: elongation factor 4 [Candidatus Uhrbacteria bacterium CG_4_10_14_0_2_um_filter_41_21]PJC24198.1 MAG: elongation factor 4 [Candidatus Uhrbacteria bacterium CG_4_9_14_0_2_um_filter_41_50]PJE74655.1 MAG: elongation factor 4 [Candidatus Uhrbacteria bacterium CG10_big_fil_rev_8_21_14_0_10_41_26]
MTELDRIRNFCIIAHIDHGKSTLADRLLEVTGTVDKRHMQEQVLDSMELERERGITIKLAPVRMKHVKDGKEYVLNLIDTPGHVDFNYEVSRSLAAVEGAVLLVDATQGVQAQTLANLYLALDQGLQIIPVLNKIDLPAADVPTRTREIMQLIGCTEKDILAVSAKTGENVEKLLDIVVDRIDPPVGKDTKPARALVFDSYYDDYRGVVAYIRVIDGKFRKRDRLKMMNTKANAEILEVGALVPKFFSTPELETGQIGYVITGLKDIEACRVGDTMTLENVNDVVALPGYKEVMPMVFAGIFPEEGDDYSALRDAIDRLKLNDAALTFEPEQSPALGFGFRAGFLGMLHLEILKERLEREYGIDLVVTVPSVAYHIYKTGSQESEIIKSPLDLPDPSHIDRIEEPWSRLDVITPIEYIGGIMTFVQDRHGVYKNTEFLSEGRAILKYEIPLSALIVDFYDKLKSISSGFASMNYEVFEYRLAEIVRMDVLVAEEKVEALTMFVYKEDAHRIGKKIVQSLMETIPRQQFVIKIQTAVGGNIVAGERLSALRKDVTAKLYGGDVTRKRKLLEKQKKGKKRMMAHGKGKVSIPSEAYLKVLKR